MKETPVYEILVLHWKFCGFEMGLYWITTMGVMNIYRERVSLTYARGCRFKAQIALNPCASVTYVSQMSDLNCVTDALMH